MNSIVSFYMFSTLLVSYTTNYPKRTFHSIRQIQIPLSVALPMIFLLYLGLYYYSNLFSFQCLPLQNVVIWCYQTVYNVFAQLT